MRMELGRIEPLDPRTVWASEPGDFTPWLQDNADVLADALGIDLELSVNEHPVGPFKLDLIGRDLTNNCVLIIENQLAQTDHPHLGQLITYAANTDAATVVWTALSFREEHRQAVVFLNDLAGDRLRFFGVEIGAVRIGDSMPAPLFKVVAQPNETHAQASTTAEVSSQDVSGRGALYRTFWERLIERVRQTHPDWWRATKAPAQNWVDLPSPFKGDTHYCVSFAMNSRLRVELYIDAPDPDEVEARFSHLNENRVAIEQAFGAELSWEPLENRKASRIAAYTDGDISRTDEYEHYLDWILETLSRLRNALEPYA